LIAIAIGTLRELKEFIILISRAKVCNGSFSTAATESPAG